MGAASKPRQKLVAQKFRYMTLPTLKPPLHFLLQSFPSNPFTTRLFRPLILKSSHNFNAQHASQASLY